MAEAHDRNTAARGLALGLGGSRRLCTPHQLDVVELEELLGRGGVIGHAVDITTGGRGFRRCP
jgi:hypothetical protein